MNGIDRRKAGAKEGCKGGKGRNLLIRGTEESAKTGNKMDTRIEKETAMIARSLGPAMVGSAPVSQVKLYKQGRGIARLRLTEVFVFVDKPRQVHTERYDRPTNAPYLIRTQPDAR